MNLNSIKLSLRIIIVFICLFWFLSIVLFNSYLKDDLRIKTTNILNQNFYNQNKISIIDNEKGNTIEKFILFIINLYLNSYKSYKRQKKSNFFNHRTIRSKRII
jgi:hypothetical protein